MHKAIQRKKSVSKRLKSKNQNDYDQYRLARRNVKRLTKNAKEIQRTDLCRTRPRYLFKSVNSVRVRDESYNPTKIINNKHGAPILNGDDRKDRWKE